MPKNQQAVTLIELLVVLAVLIITVAGGKVIWEQKVKLTPTPTPTPYSTLSPVPTSMLIPQLTGQPKTISCQSDADCPILDCIQGCPAEGPCPPCSQYKCINGLCQRVYPYYSESLGKKIQLFPGQTVSLTGTNLSLALLQIIPAPEGSFDYPTKAELEVRSGGRSEKINFIAGVLATKEVAETLRHQEVFGFRITRVELRQQWIILTVEKL